MPYINRDESGEIVALSHVPMPGFSEVERSDPELAGYIARLGSSQADLLTTDLGLVRVLEDLVELLIDKGVILFTELPQSAQQKMLHRKSLRTEVRHDLDLLGDD